MIVAQHGSGVAGGNLSLRDMCDEYRSRNGHRAVGCQHQDGICHQPLGGAWLAEGQPFLGELADCGIEIF